MRQPGKIAIWIFVIIILCVVILQSGRYTYVQDNASTNFGPSGTSAFLELVKRSGYKVSIQNSISPNTMGKAIIPVSTQNRDSFRKYLGRLKGNQKLVVLLIPPMDEKNDPKRLRNSISKQPVGEMNPTTDIPETLDKPLFPDSETVHLLERQDSFGSLVDIGTKDNIQVVKVLNGSCATNLHLDKANNASILMGLVKMVAQPGESVAFIDTYGAQEVDSSLLAKMGAPFQAAWNQLLIVVLVIFITLSVRFGLAPERRAGQRGGRELVDGLATMTRRKRNARWALRAVFDRSLAELERRHRIGREQIIQRPDLYMNPEDAMKLKQVEAATLMDISEQEAIQQAKELKRLV